MTLGATKVSSSVLISTSTRRRAWATAASPAQKPPAAAPAASPSTISIHAGPGAFSTTTAAPRAPMATWPSVPML